MGQTSSIISGPASSIVWFVLLLLERIASLPRMRDSGSQSWGICSTLIPHVKTPEPGFPAQSQGNDEQWQGTPFGGFWGS